VEQNVGFGLPRRERRGRRVVELLDMAGLSGLERRYPHQLSGGQQQRVALARALAIEPSLVLLDEPFASLDASLRAALRQDVRRVLKKAGTTALLVTHDQDEALSLADRVAIIHDGQIGQCDTPQALYGRPGEPRARRRSRRDELPPRQGARRRGRDPARAPLSQSGSCTSRHRACRPRPSEQIVLSHDPGEDHCGARVVEAEFYGHDAVVRLRADWDDSAIVVARISDASTVPPLGARVGVSVRGDVVAWPTGAGRAVPIRKVAKSEQREVNQSAPGREKMDA